jgi:preprotein translocase subunit SecE
VNGLLKYLQESRAELGRVTWTTRVQVLEGTQTVLLFVVFFTIMLFGLDWVFSTLLKLIGVLPQ